MLNLNSVMIETKQPKVLAAFYEKVLGKSLGNGLRPLRTRTEITSNWSARWNNNRQVSICKK